MGKETDQLLHSQMAMGTFEETARSHVKRFWSATPAQRLAWLEEAIELAYQAGALPLSTHNDRPVREHTKKN